jgi:alkylhydroperoxidase family enzyme
MSRRISPWQNQDAAPPELLKKIKARRVGGELIALDRMLLKSFPLAEGWNEYLKRIRTELSLNARFRELIICRVAQLNFAHYEWQQHAPVFLSEGGTQAQLDEMSNWEKSAAFTKDDRAILALIDESTRHIKVSDSTFEAVKNILGETGTVEAVAVISCYNMVSRFLVALDV